MTTPIVISLIGLILTIICTAWKLSATITECTVAVKDLTERIDKIDTDNEKEHNEMWEKIEKAEATVIDHETRLQLLEHK